MSDYDTPTATDTSFEDPAPERRGGHTTLDGQLVLDLDGYEGPIDVLLSLAREQKVDLTQISILQLADQYIAFIHEARRLRLELAADYLVMAAWLVYLKSRLLLPEPPAEDEPSGEEMAALLTFQLQRLEAMQNVGAELMKRPRYGRDFYGRGAPEPFRLVARAAYDVTLYDLLRAYADQRRRMDGGTFTIAASELYSVEQAIERLQRLLGHVPTWTVLQDFLPGDLKGGIFGRSYLASTFVASLELARQGRLRLRQESTFGPLYVRGPGDEETDGSDDG